MGKKNKQNNTYEFTTLDIKEVEKIVEKVRQYYKQYGRTVIS